MAIRVLHILNELKPSGAEVMLKVAAKFWEEFDVDADVLSTGREVGNFAAQLKNSGYGVIHLPFAKNSLIFCKRLKDILKPYDLIHLHTENANFTIGMVARLSGKPVIRTIHNAFDYKGFMRAIRAAQRKFLRLCGVMHVSIGPTVSAVERDVLYNRTSLVPNWYDAINFSAPTSAERVLARQEMQISERAVVLVLLGNCSEIKNHIALFEAIGRKSSPQTLVLHVGTGTHEDSEKLVCVERGLKDSVRFLGRLENPKTVLQCADIYVMPSLKEGFSIAALEAIGMGIPCIFSDVHGLRDLKVMFGQSCVWEPPTSDGMAKALDTLLDELDKFKIAARNSAALCREEFGARSGASRYAAIYFQKLGFAGKEI
ncbi:glycosyltransferase [Aquabacterium soli]|uniref:Glycosyltransferase n=1 Tax=Aquabacterium soli TaxID=2493092 RepID=A0A3R8TPH9_9BURK|nr:glycosyltransferase [Aquabacterium soli]RRR99941.1 glycosyltransferase [Aquabacterium soli]